MNELHGYSSVFWRCKRWDAWDGWTDGMGWDGMKFEEVIGTVHRNRTLREKTDASKQNRRFGARSRIIALFPVLGRTVLGDPISDWVEPVTDGLLHSL